jgi:hypothetical protein
MIVPTRRSPPKAHNGCSRHSMVEHRATPARSIATLAGAPQPAVAMSRRRSRLRRPCGDWSSETGRKYPHESAIQTVLAGDRSRSAPKVELDMTRCISCDGILTKEEMACYSCGEPVPGRSKPRRGGLSSFIPVTLLVFVGWAVYSCLLAH